MTFTIESPAFRNGGEIPAKYARDGDNVSPPLIWSGAPDGTRSYLLVVDDPDAPSGTFRHWALYDVAADQGSLPEGVEGGPAGVGINDFGNAGYDGPQPPRGHGVHHYHFRLEALDVEKLDLGGATRIKDIVQAAKSHVLDETELVGTFERR
jgi:Raf kinase inhibitor-like YbhB/YbcL family protein